MFEKSLGWIHTHKYTDIHPGRHEDLYTNAHTTYKHRHTHRGRDIT